jgi:hypothetical protein
VVAGRPRSTRRLREASLKRKLVYVDPEEAPLDPAASLDLVAAERRRIGRQVTLDPVVVHLAWAVAWFVGFGASYLAYGRHRVLPAWLGPTVPAVLLLLAFALSVGYTRRVGAGITGPTRTAAAMYGWSWTLGFACLTVVNVALIHHGMPDGTAILLWAASSLLLTGILQLAGGMLWRDRVTYATGVWTMVGATVAVPAGVPGNFLVLSLMGGGGFAVLAGWTRWRGRTSHG